MSELAVPDNRNRSRSRTPFHLRSQCDGENCNEVGHVHAPTKKNPKVSTIVEEVEQSSVTMQESTTNNRKSPETQTSPLSTQSKIQNSIHASLSSTDSNLPAITTTKVQIKSNQSQRTVLKSKRILNTRTEIRENIVNKAHEESNSNKSATSSTRVSPKIVENINLNDHLAYKEYKEAGEYWKKYPKTDYVYSSTYSPYRREIKPGIIAMPNMSRRSLENHQERVNELHSNNLSQESFKQSRYQSNSFIESESYLDSQDELDANDFDYRTASSMYRRTEVKQSIIQRFVTSIFTFIFTSWYKFRRIFSSETDYRNVRYTRVHQQEQGFFSRVTSSIRDLYLSVFRYIYLTIATIQFWDSCFLQSSNAGSRGKKRFLLLLLLLLPFLLLAAGQLSNESDQATIPALQLNLPVFLQSIKTFGYDLADSTKSFFNFNWHIPFIYRSHQSTVSQFPQNSLLSDQQYMALVKHIDNYIENIVAAQSKAKPFLSPEANNILIAAIVKENLINYKYQLSLEDIERIADAVLIKLSVESKTKFPSERDREYIENVVTETVKVQRSTAKQDMEASSNIDEILLKIFASPKLLEIIDQEIVNQINPQVNRVDILQNKIEFFNDQLAGKTTENDDVKYSLERLKIQHDQLSGEVNDFKDEIEMKLNQLLSDVDIKFSTLNQNQYSTIDNHVKIILMDIMGYESINGKPTNIDLKSWIRNIFVAKEYLEQRLSELSLKFDQNLKDEVDRSAGILLRDISETIKSQTLLIIERNNQKLTSGDVKIGSTLDELAIKNMIRDVLAVYDADKTGLVDYALESAGGEVLSTRCTENYRAQYQLSIFGIPIPYNYQSNTPRTAISPTVQPGNCWSFQGFPGFLVLKLNTYVFVSGFTVEHIPKALAPNGKIDSAPKDFTVWGLESEHDREPVQFGKYIFMENGTNLQYFPADNENITKSFNVVELRIESNHGNQNYTCLYRFRVHGQPDT